MNTDLCWVRYPVELDSTIILYADYHGYSVVASGWINELSNDIRREILVDVEFVLVLLAEFEEDYHAFIEVKQASSSKSLEAVLGEILS